MGEHDVTPPAQAQVVECSTAVDLLAELSPSAARWEPFYYGHWAFRGQAHAEWRLVPRAFRRGEHLSFRSKAVLAPIEDENEQVNAEAELIGAFAELADELGFELPGDHSDLRYPWKRHEEGRTHEGSWPWTGILDLVALAQHHGVPTRLLDFTLNPLVAAFFAAQQTIPDATKLAIWAIDLDFVALAWAQYSSGLRMVPVPHGPNAFLHAQSGLFLYDASKSRAPLDDRIMGHDVRQANHLTDDAKAGLDRSPRVFRLTLPVAERAHLLTELEKRRITDAHLRPTLDNVTRELQRRMK